MRLALISDIHANLHALSAVFGDIAFRGLEADTYHLGDLVGYGPHPDETVEMISGRGITGVAGNYDSTVAHGNEHCGCKYEDAEQARLAQESYEWTLSNTAQRTKDRLGRLPFRIDVQPSGGHRPGPRVILVHGTPTLNTVYWHEHRSDDFCLKMAAVAGARSGDVIAFGHTHIPWFRVVEGIGFVNAGSVGRPKDGNPGACYALVDLSGDAPAVDFIRVDYDLAAAAREIRESSLPDFFADYLEAGGAP